MNSGSWLGLCLVPLSQPVAYSLPALHTLFFVLPLSGHFLPGKMRLH